MCWGSLTDESGGATATQSNDEGNLYDAAANFTFPAATAATEVKYL